jgi:hypothetical protein
MIVPNMESCAHQGIGSPPTTAAMPLSGEPMSPVVKAVMPSAPEETMMLCPQGIAPVRYESGKGQAATCLTFLGNVTANRHGSSHRFPRSSEVFTDMNEDDALGDEREGFQRLLERGEPNDRQSPLPFRGLDMYEVETSYSSEDSVEVFPTDDAFSAEFFEPQEQSDNRAQAQYEAQASVQISPLEAVDERMRTHEMARASDQNILTDNEKIEAQASDHNILTDNGKIEAQAHANPAEIPAPSAEREQPVLTQQKVMDLIMQQQALPNNTLGSLTATSWAIKKKDFSDMLSGFRSPSFGSGIRIVRVGSGSGCKSDESHGTKCRAAEVSRPSGETPRSIGKRVHTQSCAHRRKEPENNRPNHKDPRGAYEVVPAG